MSADTIIIIAISAATLVAAILGIVWGYKWHKAGLRQNLEIELAGIERELAEIKVQMCRSQAHTIEKNSHIYGVSSSFFDGAEMESLDSKQQLLLKRKAEIDRQLKKL